MHPAPGGISVQVCARWRTLEFCGVCELLRGDETHGGRGSSGTHANIDDPTGTGFVANGSTANVTYNGDITKSGTSAGLVVDITNESAGTITFQNGTMTDSSSSGTGISFTNADGTVNFNGTTTRSGNNNHIDVSAGTDAVNGSSGTITFRAAASISNPSGAAR
jgi:hypothetical protein